MTVWGGFLLGLGLGAVVGFLICPCCLIVDFIAARRANAYWKNQKKI